MLRNERLVATTKTFRQINHNTEYQKTRHEKY